MSASAKKRPAFTLRFRDPSTHEVLRVASENLGVSMNDLAERAIAEYLTAAGAGLEARLRRTVSLLERFRKSREGSFEDDIAAFARAEVEHEDPLTARRAEVGDDLGIGALFAGPVERG